MSPLKLPLFFTVLVLFSFLGCEPPKTGRELVNVSYDPTRELYKEYNKLFIQHWKSETSEDVSIVLSHGGSGSQAKSVINGQPVDVVTLALSYDIDIIAEKAKLLPEDWQKRLPNNSCPYTSTIVFLVRKGNPKNIKNWDDLIKDGVEIITPNPKTSGGARWNYLAAWGFALKQQLGDWTQLHDPDKKEQVEAAHGKAREFVKKLFKNVKVMDNGARGSTQRFVKDQSGDVLLAWENEALYFQAMEPEQEFEIVIPPLTILAEPPVALVDENVSKRKTQDLAEEYLKFLYEPEAQEIVAKNFYRPSDAEVMKKFSDIFPPLFETFRIGDVFGTWGDVQKQHFDADAVFDQIILENAQ